MIYGLKKIWVFNFYNFELFASLQCVFPESIGCSLDRNLGYYPFIM